MVTYESVGAMWAAPQENARETSNISDPCERFAAEEAKRQEILYSWPGVKYASYNGLQYSNDPVRPSE